MDVGVVYSIGIALKAQLLKKGSWLLRLIGDKAPLVARDSREFACSLNRRCYPHIGNGSSLSLSV